MTRIESLVANLLSELKITSAPVPVKNIARHLGLTIRYYDLGEGVSGALLLDNDKATIGVNPSESRERMRFTIAHETGHFMLHRSSSALFVDREVLFREKELDGVKVLFRDESSSSGELKAEREANAFAAALLMPINLLTKELNSMNKQKMNDEMIISKLAKKFRVSTVAMTYRLTNLGLLH